MREKFIPYEQMALIQQYSGLPIELGPGAQFDWMKNMYSVPGLVHKIVASAINPVPNASGGYNVGGIDLFRNDPKDYPYAINKDVYPIVSGINPSGCIAQGPFKDSEHWITQLPARYSGIPVVGADNNNPF
jgi:hypothetical protein